MNDVGSIGEWANNLPTFDPTPWDLGEHDRGVHPLMPATDDRSMSIEAVFVETVSAEIVPV